MVILKSLLPWWLKILIKIFIYRIPIGHQYWIKLNLFKHGYPENKELSLEKFKHHLKLTFGDKLPEKYTCLELGPGDSISTGIIAAHNNAVRTYLVDVGNFAIKDINYYRDLIKLIRKTKNQKEIREIYPESYSDILKTYHINYFTNGLHSLRNIPDGSVDFIFSHSVIEHIFLSEIDEVFSELNRICSKGGYISHNIDLMDHLNYSINNLRFSERIWESYFFKNSGFYTNRLRFSQIIELCKRHKFEVIYSDSGQWENIPLDRRKLNKDFRNLSRKDLITRTMHIVLKKTN